MADTIVNRVAKSSLITFDLEKLYQIGTRKALDLSQWLDHGIVLREKDFRTKLKDHDWKAYQDQLIALFCSSDAVLPAWASLLVTTYLQPYARKVVMGSLADLEIQLFSDKIKNIDLKPFKDKSVIIKGCSDIYIPDSAYGFLINRLQQVAKKISYGEACSSVPLWSSNR